MEVSDGLSEFPVSGPPIEGTSDGNLSHRTMANGSTPDHYPRVGKTAVFLDSITTQKLVNGGFYSNGDQSSRSETFGEYIMSAARCLFSLTTEEHANIGILVAIVNIPLSGKSEARVDGNHWALVLYNLCTEEVMVGEGLNANLHSANMRMCAAMLRTIGEMIRPGARRGLSWDDQVRMRKIVLGGLSHSLTTVTRFPFPRQPVGDSSNCGVAALFVLGELLKRIMLFPPESLASLSASSPFMNFADCFSFSRDDCMRARGLLLMDLFKNARGDNGCACNCLNTFFAHEADAMEGAVAVQAAASSARHARSRFAILPSSTTAAPVPHQHAADVICTGERQQKHLLSLGPLGSILKTRPAQLGQAPLQLPSRQHPEQKQAQPPRDDQHSLGALQQPRMEPRQAPLAPRQALSTHAHDPSPRQQKALQESQAQQRQQQQRQQQRQREPEQEAHDPRQHNQQARQPRDEARERQGEGELPTQETTFYCQCLHAWSWLVAWWWARRF
jgi:hypothetical protein